MTAQFPPAFRALGSSSFTDFLSTLEGAVPMTVDGSIEAPHGTTIVALTFEGGVVMAGDRRATMGNVIAQRDVQKVFEADTHSVVGIAGTAGIAVELVRLFQVELEHYEKIEGTPLSLEGKANRLSTMLRGNLGMAMQGLAVVPLFAGFDLSENRGRIFSYDVTGGRYEEHEYHAVGSGSSYARGSLKKLWHEDADAEESVRIALEALYDAADDDSATSGPDLTRRIFPIVAVVTTEGVRFIDEDTLARAAETMLAERMQRPGGPRARLGGDS